MERTKVAFATLLLTLTACSSFDRAPASGYAYRDSKAGAISAADDRRSFQKSSARAELGPRASDRAIALRQAVQRAERELDGKAERERYFRSKPHFHDDSERLNYLQLESSNRREGYLAARGITSEGVTHPPEIQTLINQNDISLGMTREAVEASWGLPDDKEVAGNKLYGNEKWYYTGQITSSDGYMTEKRVVIFEGGRVVGWETR